MFRFHPFITAATALTIPASALAHGSFAAGDPGDPAKPARVIEMNMLEGKGTMSYMPNRIEVTKGEQIRFVISNAGELDHEFMLDSIENNAKHKAAMEKNPEMEHDDPNGRRLEPQGTSEVLWKFDTVGSFEFACLIPGHYEAGMHGVVVVKDKR